MKANEVWSRILRNYGISKDNVDPYVDVIIDHYDEEVNLREFFEEKLYLDFQRIVAAMIITRKNLDDNESLKETK